MPDSVNPPAIRTCGVVAGIRSVLFSKDGTTTLPLSDPAYWTTTIQLFINCKRYFDAPLAQTADPVVLRPAVETESLSLKQMRDLCETFSKQLICDRIAKARILNVSADFTGTPEVDGVFINQQEPFETRVLAAPEKCGMVLCALDGIRFRPVL